MKFLVLTIFLFLSVSCTKFLNSIDPNSETKLMKAEDKILNNLVEPQSAVLYSLDPEVKEANGGFRGYKILGELILSPEIISEAALEFKDAADSFKDDMPALACFRPRVGIRVIKNQKPYDYLLCYECNHLAAFDGETRYDFDAAGNPKNLNDIFSTANIPVSKPK
jgi:hypothetical protein